MAATLLHVYSEKHPLVLLTTTCMTLVDIDLLFNARRLNDKTPTCKKPQNPQ